MVKETKVIYSTDSDQEDLKYWMDKSPEERLSTVQFLREQYIILYNKQAEYAESRKRLRRVYRVKKMGH